MPSCGDLGLGHSVAEAPDQDLLLTARRLTPVRGDGRVGGFRTGPKPADTHGYTRAFAVSAALFGVGVTLAVVLLPSKQRLGELRAAASEPAPVTALALAAPGVSRSGD